MVCGCPVSNKITSLLTQFNKLIIPSLFYPFNKRVKDRDSCGSALLDDQHVATAANCVAGLDAKSITVQLNDKSSKTISSVWVDKRYDNVTGAYDFAILTLSSPVDSQFTPVCLKTGLPNSNRAFARVSPSTPYSLEGDIVQYSGKLIKIVLS